MTTTANKNYVLPTVGADFGVWGGELNGNFSLIDLNLAGLVYVSVAGNADVAATPISLQNMIQRLTGVLTGNIHYLIPQKGMWIVDNRTTGAFTVTVANSPTGPGVLVGQGLSQFIWSDGTSCFTATAAGGTLTGSTLTLSGNATVGGTITVTDPNAQGGVIILGPASGAALRLTGNGAVTPTKWIRVINGYLSVVNNAYSAEIMQLTDVGNFWVPGSITGSAIVSAGAISAGTTITANQMTANNGNITTLGSQNLNATNIGASNINSNSITGNVIGSNGAINAQGNITSNAGYLRAVYGWQDNPGDQYAAVLGKNIIRPYEGVFWCRQANGIIFQFGSCSSNSQVTMPIAFPNAFRSVTVTPSLSGNTVVCTNVTINDGQHFQVWASFATNNFPVSCGMYYMAIGY